MLSVHQHWDPLEVCAVGRSYPPEFYSFIQNPKVRSVMEKIAIETEEDYQKLITLLESFNVKVIRTNISTDPEEIFVEGKYQAPPMCPRDHTAMIGDTFFMPGDNFGDWKVVLERSEYSGYIPNTLNELKSLPLDQKEEIFYIIKEAFFDIRSDFYYQKATSKEKNRFKDIEDYVLSHNNTIIYDEYINTAMTTRIGKDLYFGTVNSQSYKKRIYKKVKKLFPNYRCNIVGTNGHCDANFCPVVPGLIVSLHDIQLYEKTFPDWEVIYLPGQSWSKVEEFMQLKKKNRGKWWVPGEELNDDFTNFVEEWLNHWVLYVEETVFDVNMLVIDEKNVICNNYNDKVFKVFQKYNITPHVINFRHRYFWDGGLHCITSDLSRKGKQKDYFPERGFLG
jgi:hypothetical protein